MKRIYTILFLALFSAIAYGQTDKNQALARQYYQTGDYEKAATLFEELWKETPQNYYYYNSLFNSLVRINEYDRLEGIVKKQVKKFKDDSKFIVDLGYVYSLQNDNEKAEKEYQEALSLITASDNEITSLANKFVSYRREDYAILVYEKGNKLFNSDTRFAYQLGYAHIRANNVAEAVEQWLNLLNESDNNYQRVQSVLTSHIKNKEVQDALETQLYQYIQKNSNKNSFSELLIWLFIQQKDFESALIQAKALDKRNQEDGGRIINLAYDATREGLYDAAIDAYEYIINKGEDNRYYQKATSELLNVRKQKIVTTPNYEQDDLLKLKESYTNFLGTYGKHAGTIATVRDLANLEANYLYNLDAAINLLNQAISYPGLSKKLVNETKLDLGDYYVLSGDVWESTLLYAQVDKSEKDSPLGEDARFRNAKLSYFKGEFEWAQAQLTILKGATTELIANDALGLSVFIMDNLGLDTSTTAMEMYAKSDLLAMQNKPNESLSVLDSILIEFPEHALTDDVLLQKANILFQQRKYQASISVLNSLLETHAEDILADDATFMIGDIYENYLGDEENAMTYYKKMLTDYSESVLVVEARKRYRILRGDDV